MVAGDKDVGLFGRPGDESVDVPPPQIDCPRLCGLWKRLLVIRVAESLCRGLCSGASAVAKPPHKVRFRACTQAATWPESLDQRADFLLSRVR